MSKFSTLLTGIVMVAALAGWHPSSLLGQQFPRQWVEFAPITTYSAEFAAAYQAYPRIPRGLLEAVAHHNTRLQHRFAGSAAPACTGIPQPIGLMGLFAATGGWFTANALVVEELSGISAAEQGANPGASVMAYAAALNALLPDPLPGTTPNAAALAALPHLATLSELPTRSPADAHPRNLFLYHVLSFLNTPEYQQAYQFPAYALNAEGFFGSDVYALLSATNVVLDETGATYAHPDGSRHALPWDSLANSPGYKTASPDYPPALWTPADPSNYSVGRGGNVITTVTIHTVQGSYAGCISWFQNPAANVSAHYVVRSSDGQVTQMVLEADRAYHVGIHNPTAVGIEHEGWIDHHHWYSTALYNSAAALVADICASNGINPLTMYSGSPTNGLFLLSGCFRVKGHQHYSSQTHVDPGPYWDWPRFYDLVNPTLPTTTYTTATGTSTDNGGAAANYTNNQRVRYLIAPAGAGEVTLTFTQFNLEANFDSLWIWKGGTVYDDFVGGYTGTTLPPAVTSSSGKILLEFWADCGTTAPGWVANWTSNPAPACPAPTNLANSYTGHAIAHLSWNAVPGASGYEVRHRRYAEGETWSAATTTATNSYALTGLGSRAHYEWQVRAICGGTPSAWAGDTLTTPSPTSFTTDLCNGRLRDSGGNLNYNNAENYTVTISPAGATSVTLGFTVFALENNFDYLRVYDGPSVASPLLATLTGTALPANITSTGGSITLRFTSDNATVAAGFDLTWACAGGVDLTPPTTAVNAPTGWVTTDFTATYTDADNPGGTGVAQRFYAPQEYNGTHWTANGSHGFFYDDCNALAPEWTALSGSWAAAGGILTQSNEGLGNTNLYASLAQTTGETYLYHWRARMNGAGTNRRHGLHIMVDNPTATERNNNYLIWWRVDQDRLEVYRNVANVLTIVQTIPLTVDANVWYDYKVTFSPSTGVLTVWRDNELITTYTDPAPFTAGSHISLRNGNSVCEVDFLRVYKLRPGASTPITVSATGHIRTQSPNPTTPGGRVQSLVRDGNHNWSTLATATVMIDRTAPSTVATVNDGTGPDINITPSLTTLEANWSAATDPHSGIMRYEYCIGTTPLGQQLQGWTDAALNTSVTVNKRALALVNGETYYFSVRAVNAAGLASAATSSNGQTVNAVLPVEELTLAGSWQGRNAQLTWTLGSPGFAGVATLERQFGAQEWRPVAQREVAPAQTLYTHLDPDVLANGTYSYRVRLLTPDGQTATSNIVELTATGRTDLEHTALYPNPSPGYPTLAFSLAGPASASLTLTDMQGRQVLHHNWGALSGGQHTRPLPEWLTLAPGVYTLLVSTSNGQNRTFRWVKQ